MLTVAPSQVMRVRILLPPQHADQFIQFVCAGLHFHLRRRIADGQAERGDGVAVGGGQARRVGLPASGGKPGLQGRAAQAGPVTDRAGTDGSAPQPRKSRRARGLDPTAAPA
jgi:hypothetical protein